MESRLLKNGRPIKIVNISNPICSIDGTLASFDFDGESYRFFTKDSFIRDIDNASAVVEEVYAYSGYYRVSDYQQYMIDPNRYAIHGLREKSRFEHFIYAENQDEIIVEIADLSEPYEFYKFKRYATIHSIEIYSYLIDGRIDLTLFEEQVLSEGENIHIQSVPGSTFFSNHISHVNDYEDQELKDEYAYRVLIASLRVNRVTNGIFPILQSGNCNDNYNLTSGIQSITLKWMSDTLLAEINLKNVLEFSNYLREFYKISFINKYLILDQPCSQRIIWLYRSYPVELLAELSTSSKLNVLVQTVLNAGVFNKQVFYNELATEGGIEFADLKNSEFKTDISELDEQLIVKALYAFQPEEADDLLDFLLLKPDGERTYYEIIYFLLDDARLERYSFVEWFVEETTNRKFFNYAVYNLWKTSRYRIDHIPDGVEPNEDGLNPQSYFLENPEIGEEFYGEGQDVILEYFSISNNEVQDAFIGISGEIEAEREWTTYDFEVKGNRVNVTRTIHYASVSGDTSYVGFPEIKSESKSFSLHLFQSISVIGYNADWELEMPDTDTIPAFLQFYRADFKELKQFDAGLNFTISVSLDAILFFVTGGASALRGLRYIKHFKKVFQAASVIIDKLA